MADSVAQGGAQSPNAIAWLLTKPLPCYGIPHADGVLLADRNPAARPGHIGSGGASRTWWHRISWGTQADRHRRHRAGFALGACWQSP